MFDDSIYSVVCKEIFLHCLLPNEARDLKQSWTNDASSSTCEIMNFLPFILIWVAERVLGEYDSSGGQLNIIQRNSTSNLTKLITGAATCNREWLISLGTDHDPRIQATYDVRRAVQTDKAIHLHKPVQVDSSQDLQKVDKVSDSHDLLSSPKHDLQNLGKIRTINNLRQSVQTDSTFHLQKPVRVDPSHNLRKVVKNSDLRDLRWLTVQQPDHDHRNSVQVHDTNDLRIPFQTDSTFDLQKSVQVDSSHNLWRPVKDADSSDFRWSTRHEPKHDLQNSVQVHATFDFRKPVKTDSTFHLQKPVQVDPSHNLRRAVKVADSHDLRKPIIQEPNHDLRIPVQVHATFDLRKPVKTDSTFYLQKPVQVDPSHNLRRPVKVADSHDLRWPTLQEPDHDLRNPVADIDFFRSENADLKLDKMIQAYAIKKSKDNYSKEHNDPIHELLHEDEQIKSICLHDFWSRNNRTERNGTRSNKPNIETTEQKVSFRNSTKDCGIPFSEINEHPNFQNRKSKAGPWMVSVQEYFFGRFRHKCGASLLNNLWVVTAAHCVHLRPKWDFLLKLGTENYGESQNDIERFVNKISIHPKYNNMNFDNDIALLRMELPVTFQPNVVPICLPDVHESMEKRKATIFGWQEATKRRISSGATQAETVPVLTNKECEVMFSETGVNESIEKNFVCAGTRSAKEFCTGDSGGPMAVLDTKGRWSLAGLYSWGKTCQIPNQPEVYISISSYVRWIEDTIVCVERHIHLGKKDR